MCSWGMRWDGRGRGWVQGVEGHATRHRGGLDEKHRGIMQSSQDGRFVKLIDGRRQRTGQAWDFLAMDGARLTDVVFLLV